MIGRIVTVTVDRKLGSYHPIHWNHFYPLNYGFISSIIGGDGEAQDAYIVGVDEPVDAFTGKIIAIIHRNDDIEEKWVVAPENVAFTKAEIIRLTHFQEHTLIAMCVPNKRFL